LSILSKIEYTNANGIFRPGKIFLMPLISVPLNQVKVVQYLAKIPFLVPGQAPWVYAFSVKPGNSISSEFA